MVGAKSFRRLISQGRSLVVLCAVLLSSWFFSAAPGVSAVHTQGYASPLLSAPGTIYPLGDMIPRVYIPLIRVFREAGIFGYVTQSGVPATGVTLDLYLRVISNESLISSVLTNTSGYYSFIDVPGISSGTGQGYFVRFSKTSGNNGDTPGRLYYWETRVLQTYTKDQAVKIGDFDIGDVMLGEPNLSGDPSVPSLPLPVTFYWTKRSLAPSDSYVFYITEYIPNPPVYNLQYQSPPLGFIDSKLITSSDLPAELVSGKLYYWYLSIRAPDGAIGAVSVMHGVKFLNP